MKLSVIAEHIMDDSGENFRNSRHRITMLRDLAELRDIIGHDMDIPASYNHLDYALFLDELDDLIGNDFTAQEFQRQKELIELAVAACSRYTGVK